MNKTRNEQQIGTDISGATDTPDEAVDAGRRVSWPDVHGEAGAVAGIAADGPDGSNFPLRLRVSSAACVTDDGRLIDDAEADVHLSAAQAVKLAVRLLDAAKYAAEHSAAAHIAAV